MGTKFSCVCSGENEKEMDINKCLINESDNKQHLNIIENKEDLIIKPLKVIKKKMT